MLRIRVDLFRCDQTEMAAVAGVTQSTISRWESGNGSPDLDALSRIRAEAKRRRLRWRDGALFGDSAQRAARPERAA